MRTRIPALLGVCAALAACGADGPGPDVDAAVELGEVVTVGQAFVQLDRGRDELWVFTPVAGERLDTSVVELEDTVYSMHEMPDGRLLVLSEDEPALHVVDLEDPTKTLRVPLGRGYDAVTISDDGRFVIAHFRPNSAGTDDSILFTANQITVVDLASESPEASEFTLAGAPPLAFMYAPPFTLADPEREYRFAVAVAESAVSLVDLTTEDDLNRQRIIPLTEPASGRRLIATDVLFSTDDPGDPNDMTMFVLASGSSEIFAVDLLPADPATGRDLQPAINQVSGGSLPVQMEAFQVDGRDKLLVVDGGRPRVVVIDVATSSATNVDMDRTVGSAIVWEQVESGDVRPKAMLYSVGSSIVYFVDLDDLERQGMGAMRALPLGRAVESVEVVDTTGDLKAVARYQSGTGLDVINLEQRRAISLPAVVQLAGFEIAGEWLFTVAPNTAKLVAVDLLNATPVEVDIVAAGLSVDVTADTILVRHDDEFGWLSAYGIADLDDGAFDDGAYAEAYGYALRELYDRND